MKIVDKINRTELRPAFTQSQGALTYHKKALKKNAWKNRTMTELEKIDYAVFRPAFTHGLGPLVCTKKRVEKAPRKNKTIKVLNTSGQLIKRQCLSKSESKAFYIKPCYPLKNAEMY